MPATLRSNEQALLSSPGSALPPAKLPTLQNAVLAACDSQDGLKDGLLSDPRACRFDPAVLLCKDTDGPSCLTAPQVDAVRKIYGGAKNPRTGEQIFPGWPAGAEAAPGTWATWGRFSTPRIRICDHFERKAESSCNTTAGAMRHLCR